MLQKKKGLYDATFDIVDSNDGSVGCVLMQGSMGSIEGSFSISYRDIRCDVVPSTKKEVKNISGDYINKTPVRPYVVDIGGLRGSLFHDQIKTGFLQTAGYHLLNIGNAVYYLYFIGFGEQGVIAPIYKADTYVGEVRKSWEVIDDLHQFQMLPKDENDILTFIILCSYMYVITYYKAGIKIKKGIERKKITTTNEYLLSKCRTMP